MTNTIRCAGSSLVLVVQYEGDALQNHTLCKIWYETLHGDLVSEDLVNPTIDSAFLDDVWFVDVCRILLPFTHKAKPSNYVVLPVKGKDYVEGKSVVEWLVG